MWILGSERRDFFALILPGLSVLALAIFWPGLGESSLVYGLVSTAVIDSGHVYTTVWRTYLHEDRKKLSPLYWLAPLFFLTLFSLWYFHRISGLWSFVVYSTLFHHIRQTYGLSKWYQSLNSRMDRGSDKYLYALSILPIVIYHFRHGVIGGYYSTHDLFLFPQLEIQRALLGGYILILVFWITREVRLFRSGVWEPNRLSSVAFPALIYGYCFLVGETITQVLFPLLIVHGSAYFAIMSRTLTKTQRLRFKTPLLAINVILLTALVFGATESYVEENLNELTLGYPLWLRAFLIGITLTPLYCHYFFDALIWKKSHPEASSIFSKSN